MQLTKEFPELSLVYSKILLFISSLVEFKDGNDVG